MRRLTALGLLIVLLALLPTVAFAQEIVVTGTVTNGTEGGALPVGEAVTLQFYSEGLWTNIYTTTLAADGTFRFGDLASETGNTFVTHVVYQDVHYYSEPSTLEAATAADILIYEPMDDISFVTIEQAHLFIVPMGDRVRIAEYYIIGNSSDRTFAGSENTDGAFTTLTFRLPPGASNLNFDSAGLGERFVGDVTAFADTLPIPPGNATVDVDFSYELPFSQDMRIERALDVPVNLVALIINSETIGLEGEQLVPGGMMNTQMGPSASYSAGPLAAGETLAFGFGEQTMTAPAGTSSGDAPSTTTGAARPRVRNTSQETGIGIVALALGGVASYLIWTSATATPPMPDRARPLVEEIAALDASFVAGDVDEADYQQQRATLKRRLHTQLRQR